MKRCDELPLQALGAKPLRYKERPVGAQEVLVVTDLVVMLKELAAAKSLARQYVRNGPGRSLLRRSGTNCPGRSLLRRAVL